MVEQSHSFAAAPQKLQQLSVVHDPPPSPPVLGKDIHDLFEREAMRDHGVRDLLTRKPAGIGVLNKRQQRTF